MGDDARTASGTPGHNGVEPARPRVAAHDVRGPANRRSGLIRARGRQLSNRNARASGSRNANDRITLRIRRGATPEDKDGITDSDRRRIVQRRRQATGRAIAARGRDPDVGARRVGRRQAAEKDRPVTDRGNRRVLDRLGEHPGRALDQPNRPRPHRRARHLGGNRLRGGRCGSRCMGVTGHPHQERRKRGRCEDGDQDKSRRQPTPAMPAAPRDRIQRAAQTLHDA